jgi:hypothetical protein
MLGSSYNRGRYLILAVVFCLSCGGPPGVVLIGSARAASADGLVDAKKIGDRGTRVTVHMERLPSPEQLGPGLKYYVVWFEGDGGKPIKAGSLRYEPETRIGDLVRICVFREFRIRITAERSIDVTAPSDLIIAERAISSN